MRRKALSVLLVLSLIISVFAGMNLSFPSASAVQTVRSGDYEYTVNENSEITIKAYLGSSREVSIPSEIDGMPVTEIGEYSFSGDYRKNADGSGIENHPNARSNKRIRKISVPSTVRTIGSYAFTGMENLSNAVLAEGLVTIGEFAFAGCSGLKKIVLPDSLVNFTLSSLDETSVEALVLGTNVKSLILEDGKGTKVRTITCNADSVAFDSVHFEGTTVIDEITVNGSIENGYSDRKAPISRIVCRGEASFNVVLSMREAGFEPICDADGNNLVFTKNESEFRKTYDTDDFRYYLNENNEAVIARYIGGKSNVSVPSVLGGHTVTAIAPLAFACMKEGGLFADDRYITEDMLVSVSLPDTVETIGRFAFAKNLALEEINIPPKIKSVASECFLGCESLRRIVLPDTLTEIGIGAFMRCGKLEAIDMQGVEKIGDNAFESCKLLSYTGFSDKLKEIGAGAFYNCNLTGTLDLSSVIKIGACAFDSTDITEVVLNDNLEKLGYGVFQGCTLLEKINFPSRLVSIGDCCFRRTGIEKAVFSEGLREIGAFAFDMCRELYILELPESIEKIGNFAFQEILIDILVIPENLAVIGYGAFGNCKELETLYFNAKDCSIEPYMNENTELDLDNLADASPFFGCSIKEIFLGEGISSIAGTFENCSVLESVIIPDTVSEIGTAAFKNCSSLELAVIPGSVTEIADDAFDGCSNLTILCFENSYVYSYAQAQGIRVSTFVVAPIPNQTYTGYEIKPEVSVSYSGDALNKNIDFGVTYANNIDVGEADVTVKGKGNYKNFSNKVKFTIVTKSIASATISAIPDQAYTGAEVTPELIVTDGSKLLYVNKDYTASYSNNKREGTATVKITGIGNYSGSLSTEFRIVKMSDGESFFTRLFAEIKFFFAEISSFFSQIFNFI